MQEGALRLLPQFEDPALVARLLDYAVSGKVRSQDALRLVAEAMYSDANRKQAWAFVKSHWDAVKPLLTPEIGSGLVDSTGSFSVEDRDDVMAFFADHKVPAAERALTCHRAHQRLHRTALIATSQPGRVARRTTKAVIVSDREHPCPSVPHRSAEWGCGAVSLMRASAPSNGPAAGGSIHRHMPPYPPGQTLLIDADDTLWENNIYFERAIAAFISYLDHHEYSPAEVRQALNAVERETILAHGYGLPASRVRWLPASNGSVPFR